MGIKIGQFSFGTKGSTGSQKPIVVPQMSPKIFKYTASLNKMNNDLQTHTNALARLNKQLASSSKGKLV